MGFNFIVFVAQFGSMDDSKSSQTINELVSHFQVTPIPFDEDSPDLVLTHPWNKSEVWTSFHPVDVVIECKFNIGKNGVVFFVLSQQKDSLPITVSDMYKCKTNVKHGEN